MKTMKTLIKAHNSARTELDQALRLADLVGRGFTGDLPDLGDWPEAYRGDAAALVRAAITTEYAEHAASAAADRGRIDAPAAMTALAWKSTVGQQLENARALRVMALCGPLLRSLAEAVVEGRRRTLDDAAEAVIARATGGPRRRRPDGEAC